MKSKFKLYIIIGILLYTVTSSAQIIRIGNKDILRCGDIITNSISISYDPVGSNKEKGFNFIIEIRHTNKWFYVKGIVQSFSALVGGYQDFQGGIGLNLTTGQFDQVRYYAGIKGGLIIRGLNGSAYGGLVKVYPVSGLEIGFDLKIIKGLHLGLKATRDTREDAKYTGGLPQAINNGNIVLTVIY